MSVYEPNKAYEWQPEDKFVLTGTEVAIVVHLINNLVQDPEYKIFKLISECSANINNILKRNEHLLNEIVQPEEDVKT